MPLSYSISWEKTKAGTVIGGPPVSGEICNETRPRATPVCFPPTQNIAIDVEDRGKRRRWAKDSDTIDDSEP